MTTQTMVFGLILGFSVGATVHHLIQKKIKETFVMPLTSAQVIATGKKNRWYAALFIGVPFVLMEWLCFAVLVVGALWRFAGWVAR